MAITKMPKACQDAPLGYQTVNALAAGAESMRNELGVEHTPEAISNASAGNFHGSGIFESAPGSANAQSVAVALGAGVHDHPLIQRGMAVVKLLATAAGPTITSTVARLTYASGIVSSMQTLSSGVYFFPIDGWAELWGRATPRIVASSIRTQVDARVYPDAGGLVVRTFQLWKVDTVNDIMGPYPCGFFLSVWARRAGAAQSVAAPVARASRSRFPRGPPFGRGPGGRP